MEHQVNRFMGCDYNIEGFWRVMKDAIGAGRSFANLHLSHSTALRGEAFHLLIESHPR
jgi:hypothetical protein